MMSWNEKAVWRSAPPLSTAQKSDPRERERRLIGGMWLAAKRWLDMLPTSNNKNYI